MMQRFRTRLTLFLFLMMPAVMGGVASSMGAEPENIVAAIPVKALSNAPFLFGLEKGFYEDEGLKVQLTQMRSSAAISGLMTGDVVVDFHSSAIRAPVAGRPVRMIGYLVNKTYFGLYAKPKIKRIADLGGGVVAVTDVGGSVTYIVQKILTANGLQGFGKDVTMFPSGSTQNSMLALLAGQVDATLLGPERGAQVEKKDLHQIARASDYVNLGMGGMSSSVDTLKNRPDTIRRFLRATLKSLNYVRDEKNKPEVVGFYMTVWNLSQEDAAKIYDKSKDHFSPDGSISREGMQLEIDLVLAKQKAQKKVSVEDVADFRLLREVQSELGM